MPCKQCQIFNRELIDDLCYTCRDHIAFKEWHKNYNGFKFAIQDCLILTLIIAILSNVVFSPFKMVEDFGFSVVAQPKYISMVALLILEHLLTTMLLSSNRYYKKDSAFDATIFLIATPLTIVPLITIFLCCYPLF